MKKLLVNAIVVGGLSAALMGASAGIASAAPAPSPNPSGPGQHNGQWLGGGNAPGTDSQPIDTDGRWVDHPNATGAQCMDRGVVCQTGIWYPDQVQSRRGQEGQGGVGESVQLPDTTGAECNNPGVVCGSSAS